MATKKTGMLAGVAVAGLAAAGIIALGGPAFAETTSTTTGSAAATTQTAAPADQAGRHQGGPGGASQDTAVTGDEATKVSDAVKATNPDVTIDSVRQDPDGSYDALGTKSDGTKVMYDVSTDLQTITENAGRQGGPGGASQDTAVTGDEATKVSDAVKATNPDVTIDSVRQDPDGSYDALGTKSDGTKVMYDVSTDLQTITENAGRQGGPGGASQDTAVTGDEATKVSDAVKATNPDVTIDSVRQDPDGSYDALGTKSDGTKVMYDVSTDLQTITENAGR